MRAIQRFVLALIFVAVGTAGSRAGYLESQEWFNALSLEQRSEIQRDLILLGYYNFLVDGAFGQGTYSGLTAFQRGLSRSATGVLSEGDLTKLASDSGDVSSRLGLSRIDDSAGKITLMLPAALLTETSVGDSGTAYRSEDGGFILTTVRKAQSDTTFADLYEILSRESSKRKLSYSSFNDERFVVSGTEDGVRFYMMYRNTGSEAVGYEMTWTQSYHHDATIVSTYLASYAEPLVPAPQPAVEATVGNAIAMRRFGAFSLPETKPYAIQLNDEIGNSTARDFEKALAARPDATVLLLDSPGGYVDTALVIANTVRQRGMTTVVPEGAGCYSACAYIFFAGIPRQVYGELGVHQISTQVADLVFAQTTLSDILDALDQYGVEQAIISHMLRTPPERMYVFTRTEIVEWHINQGDPVQLADIGADLPIDIPVDPRPETAGGAYVHLAQFASRAEAERSLDAARNRWSGLLEGAAPVIEAVTRGSKQSFRISVPAQSLDSANALCAAIKSSGGGCYVTPG